jgi:glycosyltransferase involved in cell wall biosynthesis
MALIEKRTLKGASSILCLTDMEMRNYGALNISHKVKVIPAITQPPEMDIQSRREHFRRRHQLQDSLVLLFSGRVVENKGLHLTVAALSRIIRYYPNVKLFVMGPSEDRTIDRVKSQVRDLGLEECFSYLGMRTGDDYWRAMAGADLFVLNSYSENFGNVVTEALSIGLPVLISDQVGIADLVRYYDAGRVTSLDVNDIANAMKIMLAEPEKLKETGRRGIRLVQENCTQDIVGKQMVDYLGSIAGANK